MLVFRLFTARNEHSVAVSWGLKKSSKNTIESYRATSLVSSGQKPNILSRTDMSCCSRGFYRVKLLWKFQVIKVKIITLENTRHHDKISTRHGDLGPRICHALHYNFDFQNYIQSLWRRISQFFCKLIIGSETVKHKFHFVVQWGHIRHRTEQHGL
jgi:hypothetical protein